MNDYVNYKDGNYKHLNLDKKLYYEFELKYKTGDYLAIDLDMTTCKDNYHIFGFGEFLVQSGKIEKEKITEKRDSNGNFLGFVCDTLEFLNEIGETRERYQIATIESRGSNYARIRQTSYDMPPK